MTKGIHAGENGMCCMADKTAFVAWQELRIWLKLKEKNRI